MRECVHTHMCMIKKNRWTEEDRRWRLFGIENRRQEEHLEKFIKAQSTQGGVSIIHIVWTAKAGKPL